MSTANVHHPRRPQLQLVWHRLAFAALLVLTTSLGGCAGFDASRISVNVEPDEFTSVGW